MESWAYSWFRSKPKAAPLPGEIAAAEAEAEAKAAAKANGGGGLFAVFGRGSTSTSTSTSTRASQDAGAESRGRVGGAQARVSTERAQFDAAVEDISGSTARLKEMVRNSPP